MDEFGPKSPERWQSEQLVLCRAGSLLLRNLVVRDIVVNQVEDKYLGLANIYEKLFKDSLAVAKLDSTDQAEYERRENIRSWAAKADPVDVGFRVLGKLLGYGAWAYQTYCERTDSPASIDELEQALVNPLTEQHLLKWFADTSNNINSIREENFGLRDGSYELNKRFESNPFICNPHPRTKELAIGFHQGIFLQATGEELEYTDSLTRKPTETQRCPTYDTLLPKLWHSMVDTASQHPAFFAADVAAINDARSLVSQVQ